MSVHRWSPGRAAAEDGWAALCGQGDLFCAPGWLAVERDRVGPWVPRRAVCLARTGDGGVPDGTVLAGTTAQLFDRDVHDETVRLDRMLPCPADAAALQPSLMCGTWFNSTVLTAPGRGTREHRREVVTAAVNLAVEWGAAAVFFPFLAAGDTDLRTMLVDDGFLEFPAPDRHVFRCEHASHADYTAGLRSHRRTRSRREIADVTAAGLVTGHTPVDGSNVERIAWLAHRLEAKYGQVSTLEQMTAWFASIVAHTDAIAFTASPPGAAPVAMSLWLRHLDSLYGFHAGFDYARTGRTPVYPVVGYHLPIAYACDRGDLSVLEYGVGSDQAKLLRGTVGLPQVLLVRPLTGAAREVLTGCPPGAGSGPVTVDR